MELTNKDKSNALKAFATQVTLEKKYRAVRVKYADGGLKFFYIHQWILFRDGIKTNLYDNELCKIKPIYSNKYLFKCFVRWVKNRFS